MRARVTVRLKAGVLDPQGMTIRKALVSLGYDEVEGVRQGKVFELEVAATDAAAARVRLEEMGRRLLSNPVVEDFEIEVPLE